jgi:hypothetical protein
MILRICSDCFHKHRKQTNFCNGEVACFSSCKNWIFKHHFKKRMAFYEALSISNSTLNPFSVKPMKLFFQIMITRYRDDRGLIPGRTKGFFSTPTRLNPLWGPSSIIFNQYRGLFPLDKGGRGVKQVADLHVMLRSRMVDLYLHSPCVFITRC